MAKKKAIYRIFDKRRNAFFSKWQKSVWQSPYWIKYRVRTDFKGREADVEIHEYPLSTAIVYTNDEFMQKYDKKTSKVHAIDTKIKKLEAKLQALQEKKKILTK